MRKLFKWISSNQGLIIAAAGIAIAIFSLVEGDWFARCCMIMILFVYWLVLFVR